MSSFTFNIGIKIQCYTNSCESISFTAVSSEICENTFSVLQCRNVGTPCLKLTVEKISYLAGDL